MSPYVGILPERRGRRRRRVERGARRGRGGGRGGGGGGGGGAGGGGGGGGKMGHIPAKSPRASGRRRDPASAEPRRRRARSCQAPRHMKCLGPTGCSSAVPVESR